MNGVKVASGSRGMTEAVRQCNKDRKEYRTVVYM